MEDFKSLREQVQFQNTNFNINMQKATLWRDVSKLNYDFVYTVTNFKISTRVCDHCKLGPNSIDVKCGYKAKSHIFIFGDLMLPL